MQWFAEKGDKNSKEKIHPPEAVYKFHAGKICCPKFCFINLTFDIFSVIEKFDYV